jgi:hypothetical protein
MLLFVGRRQRDAIERPVLYQRESMKKIFTIRDGALEEMATYAKRKTIEYEKKLAFITVYKARHGAILTESEAVHLLGIER